MYSRTKHKDRKHFCMSCLQNVTIRDPIHITGKFRGATHKKCNLKVKTPRILPVIFHNLERYVGHTMFKELNNFDDTGVEVIPKTNKKYMSLIVNKNIIFLDSNQFYEEKLDNHASNLQDNVFKHLISEFPIDKLELLKGKDTYPYKWVDSYEKFNYKELPPKESFYSSLKDGKRDNNNGQIFNEQYLYLQNVSNTFNFNTFRDFHNHYLKKMYYY